MPAIKCVMATVGLFGAASGACTMLAIDKTTGLLNDASDFTKAFAYVGFAAAGLFMAELLLCMCFLRTCQAICRTLDGTPEEQERLVIQP